MDYSSDSAPKAPNEYKQLAAKCYPNNKCQILIRSIQKINDNIWKTISHAVVKPLLCLENEGSAVESINIVADMKAMNMLTQ